MPKFGVMESRAQVVQMGRRMYAAVVGSSRPERTLKDEVYRLCDTLPSRELNVVLGKVYTKLGGRERTASMAEYMKELYGIGNRRLFTPRPLVGSRHQSKDNPGVIRIKLKEMEGPSPVKPTIGGATEGKVRKVATKAAKTKHSVKDNVVTIDSVAHYCLTKARYYGEVRPVYDMLMELYKQKRSKKWEDISKAINDRMNQLPVEPHTVYIEKLIHNHVEKVEAGGTGFVVNTTTAAPKKNSQKQPTRTTKVVDAVYTYKYIQDDTGKKKIHNLYKALVQLQWIADDTDANDFHQLFSGKPKAFHIKWTGAKSDLFALFKRLFDDKLITCSDGATIWVVAENHFVDKRSKPYCDLHSQREKKKTKRIIDLLLKNMTL